MKIKCKGCSTLSDIKRLDYYKGEYRCPVCGKNMKEEREFARKWELTIRRNNNGRK